MSIDNRLSKTVALYEGKNAVKKFIREILKDYNHCKKVINTWVHDPVTGKYKGSSHLNRNINLKLTKSIPAIFHNL